MAEEPIVITRSVVLVASSSVFSTSSALAHWNVTSTCSNNVPIFWVIFAVLVGLVSLVACVVWLIRRRFFREFSLFKPLLGATGLLALLLGVIGSFVVPAFETVFTSFGGELPVQTKILVDARHLLWLPALLLLCLWCASKNWKNRIRYFAASLLVEIMLLLLVIQSLYSPIFVLGCVVD
jgi:hypothetical protein